MDDRRKFNASRLIWNQEPAAFPRRSGIWREHTILSKDISSVVDWQTPGIDEKESVTVPLCLLKTKQGEPNELKTWQCVWAPHHCEFHAYKENEYMYAQVGDGDDPMARMLELHAFAKSALAQSQLVGFAEKFPGVDVDRRGRVTSVKWAQGVDDPVPS